MKIAFLTHQFLPRHFGGTERYTHDLALKLQALGTEVLVVCKEPETLSPQKEITWVEDNVGALRVCRLLFPQGRGAEPVAYLYNHPGVEKPLKEILEKERPDLVHITSLFGLTASAISAAKSQGLPMVFTATDYWFLCPTYKLLRPGQELCQRGDPLSCLHCLVSYHKASPFHSTLRKNRKSAKILSYALYGAGLFPRLLPHPAGGARRALEGREPYLRQKAQELDLIIAPTRFLAQLFYDHGFPPDKILISPYGLDFSWSRQEKIPSPPLRLGYIGGVDPAKGVHVLLKAFNLLAKDKNIELKIYGDLERDPLYVRELKALSSGEERINFLGTFDNARMGKVLSEIDLLVVPSLWYENSPLVIYSAFAARTPVVASDLGSLPEVVREGENGRLFPPGDFTRLAQIIEEFYHDRSMVEKLSAGIGPVKSMEEEAQGLMEIYRRLIGVRDSGLEVRQSAIQSSTSSIEHRASSIQNPVLSVIVVTWNNAAIIEPCLRSVLDDGKDWPLELIVVDNASTDGTPALVRQKFPPVRLIDSGSNLGFNVACNLGMKEAKGDYFFLLNPDTELVPGALQAMLDFMERHPRAGILGGQLLYPDRRLQPSCRAFPTAKNMFYQLVGLSRLFPRSRRFGEYMMTWWDHRDLREVDQPMGAALLVRRQMVEEVGLFDEDYFMLFGEVDWCYRAKQKGWGIFFTPHAQIIHHHSTSINQVKSRMIIDSHRGLYRFYRKHYPQRFLSRAGRPLFIGGLAALAGIRITARSLRVWAAKVRGK